MNRVQKLSLFFSLSCSLFWNSSETRAAIIVDVQDAIITAGGSGFVDVLISSTGTDTLDFASYDFQISLVGGPSARCSFPTLKI